MTAAEFKAIRTAKGWSISDLMAVLRITDERSVRRWEDGERPVSGPVSLLMELIRDGVIGPNWD